MRRMGNNNLETAGSSCHPQKPPLMWSPVNVANSHILKSQTVAYFSCTVAILGQKQLNTPNNGLPQDGRRGGNPRELGLLKRTSVGNLKSWAQLFEHQLALTQG